jgi:hypothetical protein
MLLKRFQLILFLSLVLNYLHGIECIVTKFYDLQPNFYFFTRYFHSIHESVYFVFHGTFWLFILLAFFLLKGGKWIFIPLALYGTVFFTEFHHFVRGITLMQYYPGMITSMLFPILGIFYWREVLLLWKKVSKS